MLNVDGFVHDWHEQALCRNHPHPDLWWYEFSKYDDEKSLQVLQAVEAIEYCNDCPVRMSCLKQGLEKDNMIQGSIWGGLMFSERARLVNKHRTRASNSEAWFVKRVRKLIDKVSQ